MKYHTVREWVQAAKSAASVSLIPKDLPVEERVRELEKENARLRREREILKSDGLLREAPVKYAFIRNHRGTFDVAVMCGMPRVTPSGGGRDRRQGLQEVPRPHHRLGPRQPGGAQRAGPQLQGGRLDAAWATDITHIHTDEQKAQRNPVLPDR